MCFNSQGSERITSYFTRFKKACDELFILQALPVCTCGVAKEIQKKQEDQRLVQFLMGLNDSYTIARGNILMISPLPTIAQVYSLLLQEEKQREIQSDVHFLTNFASLYASGSRNFQNRTCYDGRKPLFFNFCKRNGHTEDKCYKKHGYLDKSGQGDRYGKFNPNKFKGKSVVAYARSWQEMEDVPSTSSGVVPGHTAEQHQQLLSMLSGVHVSEGENNSNNMSSVNFTGITSCHTGITSCNVSINSDANCTCLSSYLTKENPWILDSGASEHMTYDQTLSQSLEHLPKPHLITLPNGYKVEVKLARSICLHPQITIHNVLFVPSFK